MATVAAIALAAPAWGHDPAEAPIDTEMRAILMAEQAESLMAEQAASPPVTTPTTAEEQPAEVPADAEVAAEEDAAPHADMQFIAVQDEAQFLANDELIGKDVVNIMDEEVGEIADLVMDRDQKLVGVVLSVGGFLGLGEKWVGVPVDTIQFPTDDQPARLLVEVTKEQLENAPDFMTREAVEAEKAAKQAQQQAMQQQQQVPSPATTTQ
jgi:sporulation protein YlmC with PRC-barrel domain